MGVRIFLEPLEGKSISQQCISEHDLALKCSQWEMNGSWLGVDKFGTFSKESKNHVVRNFGMEVTNTETTKTERPFGDRYKGFGQEPPTTTPLKRRKKTHVTNVVSNSRFTREMENLLNTVVDSLVSGTGWTKFVNPTVRRGATAWPRKPADQQYLGVRYDYHGEVTIDGVEYYVFQMQPNRGHDVPSSIKKWRQAYGGTHSVMTMIYIPKNADRDTVEAIIRKAHEDIVRV
ncbi:hypothetical protein CVT24_004341 [Panaeolus cyanescens]|uniref:Uncharacterized protein n=1 Tax=Panaeolus cyanescens TaxID=181874 RepID=A0A409WW17_9AGAR|nr:hypothetical protein CVT24_004341 [Panaeolus cyanescens]